MTYHQAINSLHHVTCHILQFKVFLSDIFDCKYTTNSVNKAVDTYTIEVSKIVSFVLQKK